MRLPQTGGCHCGKTRYEITEKPSLVYTCHCTDSAYHRQRLFSGNRLAAGCLLSHRRRAASYRAYA
jgi:hypothetical protein